MFNLPALTTCIRKTLYSQLLVSANAVSWQRKYSQSNSPKVCIVGSGPAAFSVTQSLLKYNEKLTVDMYEKLPVPFGLVRYGVSPDHQDVKNCINGYNKTASSKRFSYYGNVEVGNHVSLSKLCSDYHAVVLCFGAQGVRQMGIEGEHFKNVFTSNQFVGWYNGLPEFQTVNPDLSGKAAVVVGVGNVALDCARMLLKPVDMLQSTDMTDVALSCLRKSSITKAYVFGRRGPLQMACTRKELSEICDLSGVATFTDSTYFTENIMKALKQKNLSKRKYQRLVKYLMKVSNLQAKNSGATREFYVHLLSRPTRILSSDGVSVSGVEFQKVSIKDDDDPYNPQFNVTSEHTTVECDLLISCIGYDKTPLLSDLLKSSKDQQHEGVINREAGLYACGWCSTGPVGVLADTSESGHSIAHVILSDIDQLVKNKVNCQGSQGVLAELNKQNVKTVSWQQWNLIDKYEVDEGSRRDKPREKILSVDKMVSVSRAG